MSLSTLVSAQDRALMADVDILAARELRFLAEADLRDPAAVAAAARETVAHLALTGLLKYAVAEPGGPLPSLVRLCCVRERLARFHGLADLAFAMQGLGAAPIAIAGTPEQRARALPRIASGDWITAFAVTEEGAGSDVAAMSTVAIRDGAHYRLEGKKTFISNAGIAGMYIVFAKTDLKAGRRGVSAFMVPADATGFKVERTFEVISPHPIGTIALDDVRVPVDVRLGAEGDGFRIAMETLALFRPGVGAAAIGFATRALEESIARAKARSQFGAKLATFQAIQFYIAEMATDLDAGRLLVYRAARMKDDGETVGIARASAMAKMAATELASGVVDKAVQIFGGLGVTVGSVVERLYREVRALRIYEGTTEIQKLVIARDLLGRD